MKEDFNIMYEKLMLNNPHEGLKKLMDNGMVKKYIPELDYTQYCKQNPYRHPEITVDKHILNALLTAYGKNMAIINSIILHDIGKIVTMNGTKYVKHDIKGVPIAEEIMIDLGRPNDEIDCVKFCVKNHMNIHNISKFKPSQRLKIYEHEYFGELCDVYRADTYMRPKQYRIEEILNDKKLLISNELYPLIDKNDVIKYGIEGNEIDVAINDIIEQQLSGKIMTKEKALHYIKNKYVKWNFGCFDNIPQYTI